MTQRAFEKTSLHLCYKTFNESKVERVVYEKLRSDALENKIDDFVVPKRSGKAWILRAGDLCRITVTEGPQVGDVNLWNLANPKEFFYSGTRCDPYTVQKITGQWPEVTCHQNLIKAIEPFGLTEEHVHDVFNIFMCSGWTKDTVQYFVKGTPANKGDYIEFIAEIDLLVALSVCPQGDVSLPVGVTYPEEKCFPLGVQIYRSIK
ncbi:uncharacterized protein LOC143231701 isoform X2 [Tachypleus tridentatus]|uniref:uncharacterized protein LOC143231701 isoform X2 n=1 Tax=Tachypleus tridentatus TaxID=6853 RepID=UPI003FD0C7DA